MNKFIKVIAVMLLLATVFALPAAALNVTVNVTPSATIVATNTKDRTANSWLTTIYQPVNSYYFTEGIDVLGLRIRNTSGAAMTDYFTFDEYKPNYANVYTTIPTQGQTLKLRAQSDDSGSRDVFIWNGQWFT